jgi:heme/copper-type cytochrome/quinol oxidase subunit 2
MTLPWLPPDHAAQGHLVDDTLLAIHLVIAVVALGWGVYYVAVLLAARRRGGAGGPGAGLDAGAGAGSGAGAGAGRGAGSNPADAASPPRHLPARLAWLLVGGIALAEAALFLGKELPAWSRLRVVPPDDDRVVHLRVIAEQFAWNVHYPGADGTYGRTDPALVTQWNPVGIDTADAAARDDVIRLNQLHLPVGRPALIELTSKDVIHAFHLPVMRVKQDVIPGQRARAWFTPVVADTTDIACAQLCGLGHYRMKGQLIVETEAEWQAWLAGRE